jgi:hypothetical protein
MRYARASLGMTVRFLICPPVGGLPAALARNDNGHRRINRSMSAAFFGKDADRFS